MQRPDIMFPALFTVQHAMGELFENWGLTPDLVIGHSSGEYAAAVRAGVLDLDAAIRLVAARSTLMMQMPAGGMISVARSEGAVRNFAKAHGLSIGATNAPQNTALSGQAAAIEAAMADCAMRARDRSQASSCRCCYAFAPDP